MIFYDNKLIKDLKGYSAQPQKADYIQISAAAKPNMFMYNFKFRTQAQTAYFSLVYAHDSSLNEVWQFLEDICLGKEFVCCAANLETSAQIMAAQTLDKDTIRFTLAGGGQITHEWRQKEHILHLYEKPFPDGKLHITMDIIVNKKDFIYAFYCLLLDMFRYFDGADKNNFLCGETNKEKVRQDSPAVSNFLGYSAATPKDRELLDKLLCYESSFGYIKALLESGANPNAVIDKDKETVFENFLENADYEPEYDEEENDDDGEEKPEIPYTPADGPSNSYQQKYVDLTKLLLEYGAKPADSYCSVYNRIGHLYFFKLFWNKHFYFDTHLYEWISHDGETMRFMDSPAQQSYAVYYEQISELLDKYIDFSCFLFENEPYRFHT